MNYSLIYKTFGKPKRGANLDSNRFAKIDSRVTAYDCNKSKISEIPSIRVFITQAPKLYNYGLNLFDRRDSDIQYIRVDARPALYKNPVNNGFSHAHHKDIQYLSPLLYSVSEKKFKSFDKITLGYYVRKQLTPDSTLWFAQFLQNLPFEIDLITMGEPIIFSDPKILKNLRSHTRTYDANEFFNACSHFIYFKSNIFVDPYPGALMEAVQYGCQIIIPENERPFQDGIDDIMETIQYHTELNDKIIDNSNSLLQFGNERAENYIHRLIDCGFKFTPHKDIKNYKNFGHWLEKNIF